MAFGCYAEPPVRLGRINDLISSSMGSLRRSREEKQPRSATRTRTGGALRRGYQVVAAGSAIWIASACGDPFSATSPENAGTGGASSGSIVAGAGSTTKASGGSNGDAGPVGFGEGGASADSGAGGMDAVGGSTAGSSANGTGGLGASGTANGGGGGGGSCLQGWRGSSCDTCSNSSAPAVSQRCAQILDCYLANAVTPGNEGCEYGAPTPDSTVAIARGVYDCRCP